MVISILMRCAVNHYNYPEKKTLFLNYFLMKPLFTIHSTVSLRALLSVPWAPNGSSGFPPMFSSGSDFSSGTYDDNASQRKWKKLRSLDRGTENCVVFAGCQCVWVSVMRQRTQDTELTEYSCSSSDA